MNVALRGGSAQRQIGVLRFAVRLAVFRLVNLQLGRGVADEVIARLFHPALALVGGVHALVEFQPVDTPLAVLFQEVEAILTPAPQRLQAAVGIPTGLCTMGGDDALSALGITSHLDEG